VALSNPLPTNRWPSDSRLLWTAIAAAFAARFLLLGAIPLMDPTESRYAEIGRQMFVLGDWITPWIAPGDPFWGKPPFSFWMTAGSFQLFGVSDFAARLPHWVGGGLIAWLVWSWIAVRSRREARLAVAMLAGSLLFFVSAGAVMTDMALAIGLMAVMRGFWLALHGPPERRGREQFLMFAGLVVGLLAKGPVALMAGAPIAIWAAMSGQGMRVLRDIRWAAGGLAVLACVLPWYAMAEARTPGFLEYFIVGEHWQRFVESDWQGDLYGHVHAFPRGTIWLFAILAFVPWSFVLPVIAWKRRRDGVSVTADDPSLTRYLWSWAVVPCVVFTLAAMYLTRTPGGAVPERTVALGVGFTALATVTIVAAFNLGGWDDHRSMKSLVADYRSLSRGEPLVFFRHLPYSASFYSGGTAEVVPEPRDLEARLGQGPAYVVLRASHRTHVPDSLGDGLHLVRSIDDYALLLGGVPPDQASRVAAKRASAASASR
jgi:4-amino-4-deoxy-L-arabinose transferase-like glycosyltransferase